MPKMREEEETPDHIVFSCSKIRRVKDKWEGESGRERTK